jgi:hypothetical protein
MTSTSILDTNTNVLTGLSKRKLAKEAKRYCDKIPDSCARQKFLFGCYGFLVTLEKGQEYY